MESVFFLKWKIRISLLRLEPILYCFGEVGGGDVIRPFEVGDGAGELFLAHFFPSVRKKSIGRTMGISSYSLSRSRSLSPETIISAFTASAEARM